MVLLYPLSFCSVTAPSKFQSLTRSLLTARLRTSLGVPGISSLLETLGCGVTLDDEDAIKVFIVGSGRDDFLVKQLAIAEHLPSFSALETE